MFFTRPPESTETIKTFLSGGSNKNQIISTYEKLFLDYGKIGKMLNSVVCTIAQVTGQILENKQNLGHPQGFFHLFHSKSFCLRLLR